MCVSDILSIENKTADRCCLLNDKQMTEKPHQLLEVNKPCKPFDFFWMNEIYSSGFRFHMHLTEHIFAVQHSRVDLVWCQVVLAYNEDFSRFIPRCLRLCCKHLSKHLVKDPQ